VWLAGGKVLPPSTGGALGWHRASGVEVGLTLAPARRERRGGPVAHGGATSEQRGGNRGVGGGILVGGGGVPLLKGLAEGGIGGGVRRCG
jgi:hypothetical protein